MNSQLILISRISLNCTVVLLGTHDGIKAETANLESKKTRRMQLAQQIHRYQINSIDASLRADLKCAEDDYTVRFASQ